MGLVGFTTGFIGFLLHQMIDLISDFKWHQTEMYLKVKQNAQGCHSGFFLKIFGGGLAFGDIFFFWSLWDSRWEGDLCRGQSQMRKYLEKLSPKANNVPCSKQHN